MGTRHLSGSTETSQFHCTVFQPNQPNHNQIEHGERNQAKSTHQHEAVNLLHNEAAEEGRGDRICPEFVLEQSGHDEALDDPVREKIERHEMLTGERESACGVPKKIGQEIVRILCNFILC